MVSSSWRLPDDWVPCTRQDVAQSKIDWLAAKLAAWGVEARVVGATPVLSTWDHEDEMWLSMPRALEIRTWLDDHPEAKLTAILDDLDIFTTMDDLEFRDARLQEKFVQTSMSKGLTLEDIERL